jgi:hypothetical protein
MDSTLYSAEINDVTKWCNDFYDKTFAQYFTKSRELYKRLNSNTRPISDNELNYILIDLPITLFDASETLSQTKVSLEVIKLKAKEQATELMKSIDAKTITEKKNTAATQMIDANLLIMAYESVIGRVENEIKYSQELIMGAKKVWDSRRRTESSNPVGLVDPISTKQDINKLPDYKTPIFGSED